MKKNKKVPLGKKPFLVLSRRAIAGWLSVFFFICAWMFFIGILVGRGTAPVKFDIVKLQEKLATAGKDVKKRQQGRTKAEREVAKEKTDLDFYEALKENREDTKIDNLPFSRNTGKKKEPAPAKVPPKTTQESPKKKGESQNKALKKVKPSKTEAVQPPDKKQVAAKSKSKPSGKTFTIQIASVKVAKDADRLIARLKKKGFPAYRAIGKIPGQGIWYRVRIGEYKSRTDARRMLNKLRKVGMKPIVVEK